MADSGDYEALRQAFNARFGANVQDPEVVRRIVETPELREWSATYRASTAAGQAETAAGRAETAADRTVPPHLRAAGMRAEEWEEAQTGRKKIKEAHLTYSVAVGSAKERYRRACNEAKTKRDAALGGVVPMARVTKLNYEDLPLAAQGRVEALDGDARKTRIKLEVDWLTREAIKQARSGKLDLERVGPPDPAVVEGAAVDHTPPPSSGNGSAA